MQQQGQYPDAFYRVSIKALITNDNGQVFVVREHDDWTLPGGGLDHGEDLMTAFKRELYKETLIIADFEASFLNAESFYVTSKDAMALWMIYKIKIADPQFTFWVGEDADEVAFRNPRDFKDSESLFGQFIFKYGT